LVADLLGGRKGCGRMQKLDEVLVAMLCVEDCCGSRISEQMEGWVLIRSRERHG